MHEIEPHYHWRHLYMAEEDPKSIFFGRTYSEFEFSQTVYNYYIHPQWDEFGSKTLYLKILFVDYDLKFAIIEMIGEWNDAIENDIMEFKREVLDKLMEEGIYKFILIAESVFNFHNAARHDFLLRKLNRYIELMEISAWRTYKPEDFFQLIDTKINQRLT